MANRIRTANLHFIALETLENSTRLFELASVLLNQGQAVEAERLRKEARAKRNVSVRLLTHASGAAMSNQN
jgi:hypothetical protein